jgi:hypothetical protein
MFIFVYHFLKIVYFIKKIDNVYRVLQYRVCVCVCVCVCVLNILLYFCNWFRTWKWSQVPLPLSQHG